jgi:hypothetical protein
MKNAARSFETTELPGQSRRVLLGTAQESKIASERDSLAVFMHCSNRMPGLQAMVDGMRESSKCANFGEGADIRTRIDSSEQRNLEDQ